MNAILSDLYDLEIKAQNHEASISNKKRELKSTYDDKKDQVGTDLQTSFNEEIAAFKSEAEASKQRVIDDMNLAFSQEMQKIAQAVENDQPRYVNNFMDKVKALGVTANE